MDYAALFELSPNPYVLLDTDFRIIGMNAAYLKATGRSRESLVGRTMFEAFPSPTPEAGALLRASLGRAAATGTVDALPLIHYPIGGADGQLVDRYWSATHTPLRSADGVVRHILQHTVDVTELHQLRLATETLLGGARPGPMVVREIVTRAEAVQAANDALASRIKHLTDLFDQAPGFMAIVRGPDHVFELANRAYLNIVGRSDLVGLTVREALPELTGQGFFELLDEVFRTGKAYIGRRARVLIGPAERREADERFLDFIYQPVFETDGTVSGIFVQGHDVTDQTRAESELQRLNVDLERQVAERTAELRQRELALQQSQKLESIGKLTGGVAHDFNNLLQVIAGNLNLLAKDVAGQARAEQRVRSALDGVMRGAKLAAQLLAFSRRQPLEPKVINIGRFVRGLDDMLRRALGEEIEIETIVAGGLWNSIADPTQVENALLNLAINARDAMDGHGKLTIEVGNAYLDDAYVLGQGGDVAPGQYVMLAVTDTGSGIPAEILDRVYEPFFTTKGEGRGTGLGLSMVYGFVKQSGGHIRIYSEVGHGTTIRLYLPRSLEAEDEPVQVDPDPATGGTEAVLVVEDDDAVRATVVDLLADLGYRVLKARDAASALAIIESGVSVDVLFTDVVMPGPLRSPDLARKARERLPGIAVLFTSGYTENAIVHGGRLDPGVELLSKPYTRTSLARKIRHVLRNKAQGSAPAEALPAAEPRMRGATRVLLVEDDALIRMNTADVLSDLGYAVTEAGRMDEAEGLLRQGAGFDLLITDVGLPDGSGATARRLDAAIAVVFASGRDVLDRVPPEVAGGRGYRLLVKPYTATLLDAALRDAVR